MMFYDVLKARYNFIGTSETLVLAGLKMNKVVNSLLLILFLDFTESKKMASRTLITHETIAMIGSADISVIPLNCFQI